MRKYAFVVLSLALLFLGGCSAFQVEFRDEQGRALDHPYGDEPVIVTLTFQQRCDVYVAVSVNGGPKTRLLYGTDTPIETRSQKNLRYELWWAEWLGSGDSMLHGQEHHVVGLYTGRPIVIDEMLLYGVSMVEIVISNEGSETTNYFTNHNDEFTLQAHEGIVLRVPDGEFRLTWQPAGSNYTGEPMRGRKVLTLGKKASWNGKLYEDHIYTYRSRPNSYDLRRMRGSGYLPL